jgi:ketosteroid isomerase-like protein
MRLAVSFCVATIIAAICLLSCGTPGPPATEEPAASPPGLAAVHQLIDEWIRMVNANDPEGLVALTCDNLEVIPPGMHPVSGADARDLFRGFFDGFSVVLEPTTSEVFGGGDWAIRRYGYTLTLTPQAGGEAIIETGHGIHIFHRRSDGSWCLAKDIWNSVAELSEGE